MSLCAKQVTSYFDLTLVEMVQCYCIHVGGVENRTRKERSYLHYVRPLESTVIETHLTHQHIKHYGKKGQPLKQCWAPRSPRCLGPP